MAKPTVGSHFTTTFYGRVLVWRMCALATKKLLYIFHSCKVNLFRKSTSFFLGGRKSRFIPTLTLRKNLTRVVHRPDGPVDDDVELVDDGAAEVADDRLQRLRRSSALGLERTARRRR